MAYDPIAKPSLEQFAVRPNLYDYDEVRANWSWDDLRKELDGLPGGGLKPNAPVIWLRQGCGVSVRRCFSPADPLELGAPFSGVLQLATQILSREIEFPVADKKNFC